MFFGQISERTLVFWAKDIFTNLVPEELGMGQGFG
jgi:hypothetical protein